MYLKKFVRLAFPVALLFASTSVMAQKMVFHDYSDGGIEYRILRGATVDGTIKFFEHGRPQPYSITDDAILLYGSDWEVEKRIDGSGMASVINDNTELASPRFFDFDNEAPCDQHQRYELTQTLFNSDLNYEFIIHEYEPLENGHSGIDRKSKRLKIVNDKGNVLCTIELPEELPEVLDKEASIEWIGRIFGKLYLCVEYRAKNDDIYYIYEIERSNGTLNVKKTELADRMMRFLQSSTGSRQALTIEVEQPSSSAHKITVADASGRVVAERVLPKGERVARFQTRELASGVYAVALSCDGKVVDSGKVVVR